MEVSGEILKKKYHTLQDAIKAADEINKEGIKYDS